MKAIVQVCLLVLVTFVVSDAHAGRNLNNLGIHVNNLEQHGALPAKYFDGTQVFFTNNSDIQYVEKRIKELQRDLQTCQSLWQALTPEELATDQAKDFGAKISKWLAYQSAAVDAYNAGKKAFAEGDAQCRAFSKEVMDNSVTESMASLMGHSTNSGNSPGGLVEIKDRAKVVAAACAKPEYANVGVNTCAWMKVGGPHRDPSKWCEVAPKWKDILTARVDAGVAKKIESFKNRPLVGGNLKGDQSLTFFAQNVPTKEGWRQVYRIEDVVFPDEWKKKYVDQLNQQYADIELDKRVDISAFGAIEEAYAELREQAVASASGYELPKADGSDYSAGLAKKQAGKLGFKAKVVKAFLSRNSFHINKNDLGIPLSRSKPGYVLIQPAGQKLCTLISYTLSEDYKGGGKYQKAKGVLFQGARFQPCR